MLFKRKKDEIFEETNDVLIIFDDEAKTSDIQRITDIREDSVYAPGYCVPIGDCEVTNSYEGRHFFYRAPSQSVTETRRLAQLEKNLVLTQITKYKPPVEEKPIDFTKIGLMVLLAIALFGFMLSSCSGG